MSGFDAVENVWVGRLGSLRNVVRQHAIREQLRGHSDGVQTVLDVGCGQGAQAIEAGRRDPYRRLGSQIHIVARR